MDAQPHRTEDTPDGRGGRRRWWDGAVGYQVYIRSFDDADGDGVGDLAGIRRRLPHLADLGVDLVWITPFYPSPQADHGYDVADYTDVDPTFGTLDDLDALVADAHGLGLRVVADLVPNHTSSEHPWFRAALRGEDPYVDYYVWRDAAPDGGPPNNWVSHFGGPAWTWSEERGQYYMHLFLPEQPDLDWTNEAVRAEFDEILRFWFRRGVDGLRIDVAHSLVEDPDFRDNPLVVDEALPADADPGEVFRSFEHAHDLDQEGVLDIYRRWHRIAEEHDAVLIGEVYLLAPEKLGRYVADDALHAAFSFAALHAPWDGDAIRDVLVRGVAHGRGRLAWPLSSHDDPHAAERFGGGDLGARRARAYFVLLSGLPGLPFLYQGDELGLDNGGVTDVEDPIAVRNAGATGRDGSRTPMPWDEGPNLGFTTGTPWLALGDNRRPEHSAAAQAGDPGSHLELMRAWLATRRELGDLTGGTPVTWLTGAGPVVAYRRGATVVAMSTGDAPTELLGVAGTVRYVSAPAAGADTAGAPAVGDHVDGAFVLPPDTTVVVGP